MFVELVNCWLAYMVESRAAPCDVVEVTVGRPAVFAVVGVMVVGARGVGTVPGGVWLYHLEHANVLLVHMFTESVGDKLVDGVEVWLSLRVLVRLRVRVAVVM